MKERCIDCGHCHAACPNGVVRVESHIERVRQLIKENETVVASLSPAWVADFPDIVSHRMIEALKLLGFTYVSESSLGANKVVEETARLIKEHPSIHITSMCPTVNLLIQKYHHPLVEYLLPLDTPSIAHAKMIKAWYGENARVVHISPCVAAKEESARQPGLMDAALTFEELKSWMKADGVDFARIPGNGTYAFEPFAANRHTTYVLENGAFNKDFMRQNDLEGVRTFHFSGLVSIPKILGNSDNFKVDAPFLMELFACDGGCVQGIGSTRRNMYIHNELSMHNYSRSNKMNPAYRLPPVHIHKQQSSENVMEPITEEEIGKALETIDIFSDREHLNCGGCGYANCRSFAKALVLGHVNHSMCVWHLKQMTQHKFAMLLQKMPSGVVIVDDQMRVVEANGNFARMLGPEAELLYDSNPGMHGYAIQPFVPFHRLFANMFESGKEVVERDVEINGRLLKITLFTLQKGKSVCCIVRNLFLSDVRNDEIINRSQRVIRENMATVQKIAHLLGENASRTEAILNSIIESQLSVQDEK